ncbi:unnamed protein product [Tilletia controversa]|nr:unnamed protein product [Tilletia controversa]
MSYAQQPPAYGAAAPTPTSSKGAYQPLPQHDILAQASASASAQSASAHQQLFHSDTPRGEADEDDPDDFKYGTTVSQCSLDVRHAFLRKVYTTLFLQLLGTTVLEALSLGAVVSYVDQVVVLQAMIITCFAFVGLTLITLQSRWDFESMGSWLFGGLLILVGAGFVQIFLPFSRTLDLVMAGAGTVLFSLYIVYDTSVILKRLSPEDWVLANLSLYLDIINLFINILRILNGVRDD